MYRIFFVAAVVMAAFSAVQFISYQGGGHASDQMYKAFFSSWSLIGSAVFTLLGAIGWVLRSKRSRNE